MRPPEFILKTVWTSLTFAGTRRLASFVKRSIPAYQDTIFCFDCDEDERFIALTIDDGIARNGKSSSLVPEVLDILQRHGAAATFFVCTEYTFQDEGVVDHAKTLISKGGCELGNHLGEDLSGHYSRLSKEEFRAELRKANDSIDRIIHAAGSSASCCDVRWFRAPQGVLTSDMREEVLAVSSEAGSEGRPYYKVLHVLGDCYCDDWAVSDAGYVARTMLRQIKPGSIAILHMPERGFRESGLEKLKLLLEGLSDRGYRCVTLSEMYRRFGHKDSAMLEQNAGSGVN